VLCFPSQHLAGTCERTVKSLFSQQKSQGMLGRGAGGQQQAGDCNFSSTKK